MIKGVIKLTTIGDKYDTPEQFWEFITTVLDPHLNDIEIAEIQIKDI